MKKLSKLIVSFSKPAVSLKAGSDTTFSEPVYAMNITNPDLDTIDPENLNVFMGSYMRLIEQLSFVTAYPYEVATKLTGIEGHSSDSIRTKKNGNKWIKINGVLIYYDTAGENVYDWNLYIKPAE